MMFSDVRSENAALLERLVEIHSKFIEGYTNTHTYK